MTNHTTDKKLKRHSEPSGLASEPFLHPRYINMVTGVDPKGAVPSESHFTNTPPQHTPYKVYTKQRNLSVKDTSLIKTLPVVPATIIEKYSKQPSEIRTLL